MRIVLKFIFLLLFAAITFSLYAYFFWYKPKFHRVEKVIKPTPKRSSKEFTALITNSSVAKKFAITNHLNSGICFLVDMKISSGRNRFFVYDLQKDSIISVGLVAHGSCDNGFQLNVIFLTQLIAVVHALGNLKLAIVTLGSLDWLISYTGLIHQTVMLIKEVLFYILINVFPNMKHSLCPFATVEAVPWCLQGF